MLKLVTAQLQLSLLLVLFWKRHHAFWPRASTQQSSRSRFRRLLPNLRKSWQRWAFQSNWPTDSRFYRALPHLSTQKLYRSILLYCRQSLSTLFWELLIHWPLPMSTWETSSSSRNSGKFLCLLKIFICIEIINKLNFKNLEAPLMTLN